MKSFILNLSRSCLFLGFMVILTLPGFSQNDNNPLIPGEKNFYEVQKAFEEFYNNVENKEGLSGWKQYKRWEWFMSPRVYPTGVLPNPMATYNALNKPLPIREDHSRSTGNWTSIGPGVSSGTGIGRINFVCFHPKDSNIIFIGAPAGGLWKTTDGGTTWITNTDQLPVIGFSDMLINPENPNIMYLASGDGDAYDTYSLGVLKSTDGGKTWNTTGLNWNVTSVRTIRKLIMHPDNPDTIFAATTAGIYRTVNGGSSWNVVQSGGFVDIEFKPGNPRVIYASAYSGSWTAGAKFFRSVDGGNSFKEITVGFAGKSNRIAIAVTSADTNYVYIVASESPTSDYNNRHGFYAFYRSTNGADTFIQMSTTPNILGWSANGNDQRGQGWYDLEIIASPQDRDMVFVGGVNIWKTVDGGTSWKISAHWTGSGGAAFVHADIHAMKFDPWKPKTFYVGSDGGLFKTYNNGRTYTDISQTMVISQIYKIGVSSFNPNLNLNGLQDNGTKLFDGGWSNVIGGDGMECIIDYTDDEVMYGSLYYGDIRRSTNGGKNFGGIKGNINEEGGWVTPYILNPRDSKKIIAGYKNIWVNYNRGTGNWKKISNFGGETMVTLDMAYSDTNVIYAAKSKAMYRTRDGGKVWNGVTTGLPTSNAEITDIKVRPDNANVLWVSFSGYSDGNKVFVSTNGGDSWINYSGSLPNLPVNCIVFQKGSDNGIYVGTDVGIYYRDSTLSDWVYYSDGLPNVIVNDLEIYYNSDKTKSRIKAATYGRGLWESELYYTSNTPPSASFEASKTEICQGYTIMFTNKSVYSSNFKWYFPGGNPSTSTERNPKVQYTTHGVYDVILVAENAAGKDSVSIISYIHVDSTMLCVYNMPATTSGEVYTTCSGMLLDPGGSENYPSNTNVYVTIAPPGATGLVLTFTQFSTEKPYDVLEIYDGNSVASSLIGSYSGSSLPEGGIVVSSGGSITLRFKSDALDNRLGFELTWRCLRPGEPPFAYLKVSDNYSCKGTIKFEDHSLNNPTKWFWDFGDGTTSTDKNPIHKYKTSGYYTVYLIASNSVGTDSVGYKGITIEIPDAPIATPSSSCTPGKVTLTASGENTIYWYESISDLTPVGKGKTFITPDLTASKKYYVRIITPSPSSFAGPYTNSIGSGGNYSGSQGLIFDCFKDMQLTSVRIYANGAGNRSIQLKDSAGNIVFDTSVALINGDNRVNLEFDIQKGNNYILYCANANLYRNNTGAAYPYVIPGLVSIKTSTAGSSYYYFFYDWEVKEQNYCESHFTEVEAGIFSSPPVADYSYKDSGLYVSFTNLSTNISVVGWDFGDSNTSLDRNPVYKYTKAGNYSVKLYIENACGKDSITKSISIINSVPETENGSLKVFPNPSEGKFYLQYSGSELINIRILDINGQLIQEVKSGEQVFKLEKEFDLQTAKGIYFIHLIAKDRTLVEKIILN